MDGMRDDNIYINNAAWFVGFWCVYILLLGAETKRTQFRICIRTSTWDWESIKWNSKYYVKIASKLHMDVILLQKRCFAAFGEKHINKIYIIKMIAERDVYTKELIDVMHCSHTDGTEQTEISTVTEIEKWNERKQATTTTITNKHTQREHHHSCTRNDDERAHRKITKMWND